MTTIEGEELRISANSKKIFEFLTDLNNFQYLMPEQIKDWTSTEKSCSFNIDGMAQLSMKIEEEIAFSQVVYVSSDEKPFSFKLICDLTSRSEIETLSRLKFEADLNPMLKMMVVKPLKNLLDLINAKLKELMEKE